MKYVGMFWRGLWFPVLRLFILLTAFVIMVSYGPARAIEWLDQQ